MRKLLLLVLVASSVAAVDKKQMLSSEAFLHSHPDLDFRLQGLQRYDKGDLDRAFELFRRAARYADKPSQAMIAQMYWRGDGVPQDRALGYAWMDLAAERNYKTMVVKREAYWHALDEGERRRAVQQGEAVYLDYGDAVAQPRLEKRLRQAKTGTTGSRAGFVGNLRIEIQTPAGPRTVRGDEFYAKEFWEPALYWKWQEDSWNAPAAGEVEVGPLTHEPH